MSNPAHVPAILQEPRRHRYLKLIALFKIGKGVLLLLLGVSLLFLNARTRWMDLLSNWAADEILLEPNCKSCSKVARCVPPVFWPSFTPRFFSPKELAFIWNSDGQNC